MGRFFSHPINDFFFSPTQGYGVAFGAKGGNQTKQHPPSTKNQRARKKKKNLNMLAIELNADFPPPPLEDKEG
jgi:hypothetical protein